MTAEEIVRKLAEADPVQYRPMDVLDLCWLCHEFVRGDEHHAADCPWRMAREWVAAPARTEI